MYGGNAWLGETAALAGAAASGAAPRGVAAHGLPPNGFAAGSVANGLVGYSRTSPVKAAATVGGLVPQQLHQAAGAQQQQQQQQHQADAAAVHVAEHLEAAHRAYKAGRHLEALQLCNTVRASQNPYVPVLCQSQIAASVEPSVVRHTADRHFMVPFQHEMLSRC